MNIPVPTTPNDLIKAYLLCLNPILKLKPREMQLLDAMLKVYFNLKKAVKRGEFKLEDVDNRLNDPMGRKVIRDLIGMSQASHDNHISALKKKKVLNKNNNLQSFLKNLDNEKLEINYKITIVNPKPVIAQPNNIV